MGNIKISNEMQHFLKNNNTMLIRFGKFNGLSEYTLKINIDPRFGLGMIFFTTHNVHLAILSYGIR